MDQPPNESSRQANATQPPADSNGGTILDLPVATSPNLTAPPHAIVAPVGQTTRVLARDEQLPMLGRYRIVKEHARGGMGRVLLAVDTAFDRKVAIKQLLSGARPATPATSDSAALAERFLREARVTGRLEHPNIVPVYEIGAGDDGSPFYSMRYVGGVTLAQRLDEIRARETNDAEKLTARLQLLDAFYDTCNAVAYAHSRGVIHRDLKPANIMLGEFGETVVLDWGLARLRGDESSQASRGAPTTPSTTSSLTIDGAVVGTPAYMPPEQAEGAQKNVDERSDVYALGAVLYELLTGDAPYRGSSAAAIVQQVAAGPPPSVLSRSSAAPRELAALCAHAMEREREKRLGSALELAREVKAFRDGKTLASYEYTSLELLRRFLRRQWKLVAVAGVALVVTGLVGVYAFSEVVRERNAAKDSLNLAALAEIKRGQAAEELAASRKDAVARAKDALKGYDAALMLRDLFNRADAHRRGGDEFREPNPGQREQNRALITSVLGFAAQMQELARLEDADAAQLEQLRRIQRALVELALADCDFELATYLLSGSNLPDNEITDLTGRANRRQEQARLSRAALIRAGLEDARLGLRREGRPESAPTLAAYVKQWSALEDEQAVRLLGDELAALGASVATRDAPTMIDLDLADLLCGSLGKSKKASAISHLEKFLAAQTSLRLAATAARALADCQQREATLALLRDLEKRDFTFFEANRPLFARAFLPAGDGERADYRGVILFARREHTQALKCFDQASPGAFSLLYRGLLLLELGRGAEALATMKELVALAPQSLVAKLALARCQEDDAAEQTLNAAVEEAGPSPLPLLARARFWLGLNPLLSERDGRALTQRWPNLPECWGAFGDALRMVNRLDESLEAYDEVISLDPDHAEAWIFKAEVLRNLDRPFKAVVERAVDLSPDNSHALAYLCQAYFFGLEFDKAIETGKRAVAIERREQEAWFYLALSYLRRMDGKSIGVDVNNARARNSYERSNMEEAAKALLARLAINPDDFPTRSLLCEVLAALGRDGQAQAELDVLVKAYYSTAGANVSDMSGVRRVETLLVARRSQKSRPTTQREYMDAAFIEAFESMHEDKPDKVHARLRNAIALVEQAEALSTGPLAPDIRCIRRRVRVEIANSMRRAGIFHGLPEILHPALNGEPDWLVLQHEFTAAEAVIALGLQYRDGNVNFLGRDESDRNRALSAFDALTGIERKARGNQMVDDGLRAIRDIAMRGYNHSDLGQTIPLASLKADPRMASATEEFKATRRRGQVATPYDVAVIGAVRPGMQAISAGLKKFDVIYSVDGRRVHSINSCKAEIAKVEAPTYELVVHRFERDSDGKIAMRLDADRHPLVDERGNPRPVFTELRFTVRREALGITVQNSSLPHPMDE